MYQQQNIYRINVITEILEALDCADLTEYGFSDSGVYTLSSGDTAPHPFHGKDVYCDMETEGGG